MKVKGRIPHGSIEGRQSKLIQGIYLYVNGICVVPFMGRGNLDFQSSQ